MGFTVAPFEQKRADNCHRRSEEARRHSEETLSRLKEIQLQSARTEQNTSVAKQFHTINLQSALAEWRAALTSWLKGKINWTEQLNSTWTDKSKRERRLKASYILYRAQMHEKMAWMHEEKAKMYGERARGYKKEAEKHEENAERNEESLRLWKVMVQECEKRMWSFAEILKTRDEVLNIENELQKREVMFVLVFTHQDERKVTQRLFLRH